VWAQLDPLPIGQPLHGNLGFYAVDLILRNAGHADLPAKPVVKTPMHTVRMLGRPSFAVITNTHILYIVKPARFQGRRKGP
jgi:hypothetical protein